MPQGLSGKSASRYGAGKSDLLRTAGLRHVRGKAGRKRVWRAIWRCRQLLAAGGLAGGLTGRLRCFWPGGLVRTALILLPLSGLLPGATFAASSDVEPRLAERPCPFENAVESGARCYDLLVPRRHTRPEDGQIRLGVIRFASQSPNPAPDPVVVLNGGPGQAAFPNLSEADEPGVLEGWLSLIAPFRHHRDVWIPDQRGVGMSRPLLDCPELEKLAGELKGQGLSRISTLQREKPAIIACRDRLLGQNTDFAAFNSWESARDMGDLFHAAGLEQVNLFGISYGSRLGFEVMRQHEASLRSVVFDSTFPPDVRPIEAEPAALARSVHLLVESCQQDPACQKHWPGLEEKIAALTRKLGREPVRAPGNTGAEVILDDFAFLAALSRALAVRELIPYVPDMVFRAEQGDYRLLAAFAGEPASSDPGLAEGLYLTIECGEVYAWTSRSVLEARAQRFAPLGRAGLVNPVFFHCPLWPLYPAGSMLLDPVRSDLPVLLLSGRFDPVTPPDWSAHAARTLTRSVHLIFDQDGHDVTGSNYCALKTAARFMDAPEDSAKNPLSLPDCNGDERPLAFLPFPLGGRDSERQAMQE